ncbi:hypothetical protein D3C87_1187150 [compost metagenome]
MTTAHQFAQMLRNIEPGNTNVRLARSLTLVHAFAMVIPCGNYANADQAAEASQPLLKKLINEVNEHVSIDTRLCMGLLLPTLKLRYELINGTTDPALIKMVLNSEAAAELKGPDDLAMTEYMTSRPGYAKEQILISEAVRDLISENS